jgi:hypothetical protein
MVKAIQDACAKRSWVVPDEIALQERFARLLAQNDIPFQREVRLNPTDRIDFVVGEIGIELKVKGAVNAVLRQLDRYAASGRFSDLVVVSTQFKHRVLPSMWGNVIAPLGSPRAQGGERGVIPLHLVSLFAL